MSYQISAQHTDAVILMPLLRLMLNRAPKLTARTFYAPLLRFTHNRATNRFNCAETEVYC